MTRSTLDRLEALKALVYGSAPQPQPLSLSSSVKSKLQTPPPSEVSKTTPELESQTKLERVENSAESIEALVQDEKIEKIHENLSLSSSEPFFTTQELSEWTGLSLPTIRAQADREHWLSRPRAGRGGGLEYAASSLPLPLRSKITLKVRGSEVKLSDELIANARQTLVSHLLAQSEPLCSAINILLKSAEAGTLEPHLLSAFQTSAKNGGKTPTFTTIFRWAKSASQGEALLPATAGRPIEVPEWLEDFMVFYRRPTCPSAAHAYRLWQKGRFGKAPALSAVYYWLNQVSEISKETSRRGPNELLKLKPYIKRNTSTLYPASVYTADGHCMDMEVCHPFIPNKLVRPEVTLMLDVHTRLCVGVAFSLAENTVAISQALESACCTWGVPAALYTDNGKGFKNKHWDDPTLGILAKMGIQHRLSIPGRSQSRGLIERAHQTILVRLAKEHAGYMGAAMDADAKQRVFKESRKALAQGLESPHHLKWFVFVEKVKAAIVEYNNSPHSSIENKTPLSFWNERLLELNLTLVKPLPSEFHLMARPSERRKVKRGWVSLFNLEYFSEKLAEFNGDEIEVQYELHDHTRLWCLYQGRFICEALLNGSAKPYFEDMTRHEQKVNTQVKSKIARLNEDKRALEREAKASVEASKTSQSLLEKLNAARPEPKPAVKSPIPLFGSAVKNMIADLEATHHPKGESHE